MCENEATKAVSDEENWPLSQLDLQRSASDDEGVEPGIGTLISVVCLMLLMDSRKPRQVMQRVRQCV